MVSLLYFCHFNFIDQKIELFLQDPPCYLSKSWPGDHFQLEWTCQSKYKTTLLTALGHSVQTVSLFHCGLDTQQVMPPFLEGYSM